MPSHVSHAADLDEVRPIDFGRAHGRGLEPITGPLRRHSSIIACVAIVSLVIVVPTGVAVAGAPGEPSVQVALTTFKLASCAVLLVLGFALSLRYYVFNEARIGWLAMAIMLFAMSQVTESVLLLAANDGPPPGEDSALRLITILPAAIILGRCLSSPVTDDRLRPVSVGLLAGGLVAVASAGARLALEAGWVPRVAVAAGDAVLAIVVAGLAVALFVVRSHAHPAAAPWLSVTLALFSAALGFSALSNLTGEGALMVASMTVALIGVVTLVVIVFSLLWEAYEENQRRVQEWLERAQSAENARSRAEECLHQVRGSVAAVARGIEVLGRYGHDASESQRSRLAMMIDREVERLGQLVSREAIPGGDRVELVPLDDLIHSTVRLMRLIDRTLEWNPSGQWATCDGQATSEILRILLENTQRHAPGSAVVVSTSSSDCEVCLVVTDRGPGVPRELGDSIFEKHVRSADSVGEGLGLHMARRLARAQGGDLVLVPTPGRGASFSLNLPIARIIDLPLTQAGLTGR